VVDQDEGCRPRLHTVSALWGSQLPGCLRRKGGEEGVDRVHQGVNAAVQAVGGYLSLQASPDLLDRVMLVPGIGWQPKQFDRGMCLQPCPNDLGLVDAGIVQHEQNGPPRIGLDQLL